MQASSFISAAFARFKQVVKQALVSPRTIVMGPVDRLARFVDVGNVLDSRGKVQGRGGPGGGGLTRVRGMNPSGRLALRLHRRMTAPRRHVVRLFEPLNHLS
jgi:hypothetical protein